MHMEQRPTSLQEFHLIEHRDPVSRVMRFLGTASILPWTAPAIATASAWWSALIPVTGHGFARVRPLCSEPNRAATCAYPGHDLPCHFILSCQLLTGRRYLRPHDR